MRCSIDAGMREKERNEMEMAMELRLVLQETLTACLVAAEAATFPGVSFLMRLRTSDAIRIMFP